VCTQMPASLDSEEEAALLEQAGGRVSVFDFGGPLSFGAAADLGHHVRERALRNGTEALVLDFSRVPFMDVSAARAVETIACDARQTGKRVFCSGIREEVEKVLRGLDADHCIPADCKHPRRIDALRAAVESLEGQSSGPDPAIRPTVYGAAGSATG